MVTIDRRVEWIDTDASGHQHNSVIMRWVEAAEAELMRLLDLPEYFPSAPRVQQIINFTGRLWFGQPVHVSLWTERVGTTSLTFGFEVRADAHDRYPGGLASHGSFTTVWLPIDGDGSTGAWPETMRQRFLDGRPDD